MAKERAPGPRAIVCTAITLQEDIAKENTLSVNGPTWRSGGGGGGEGGVWPVTAPSILYCSLIIRIAQQDPQSLKTMIRPLSEAILPGLGSQSDSVTGDDSPCMHLPLPPIRPCGTDPQPPHKHRLHGTALHCTCTCTIALSSASPTMESTLRAKASTDPPRRVQLPFRWLTTCYSTVQYTLAV